MPSGTAHASALFGARNEILAFQVIVEAGDGGIRALSVALPELRSPIRIASCTRRPATIRATPSGVRSRSSPSNYMHVTTPSRASWVWEPGAPAAPRTPLGWKPVQLVPENARPGRGGFPLSVAPGRTQAIWIEIYTGRDRPAGVYEGRIDGARPTAAAPRAGVARALRLRAARREQHARDGLLSSDQPELYHGRNLDAAYHRFAHRHRIELVHAYDIATATAAVRPLHRGRLHARRAIRGPGRGRRQPIVPASFYGPGRDYDDRASAWRMPTPG